MEYHNSDKTLTRHLGFIMMGWTCLTTSSRSFLASASLLLPRDLISRTLQRSPDPIEATGNMEFIIYLGDWQYRLWLFKEYGKDKVLNMAELSAKLSRAELKLCNLAIQLNYGLNCGLKHLIQLHQMTNLVPEISTTPVFFIIKERIVFLPPDPTSSHGTLKRQ